MTLVLYRDAERVRAEQTDRTIAANVLVAVVMSEPREGEVTSSENNVNYQYSFPNETTLNAIREVEAGEIVRCRNEKHFFEQLNSD